MTDDILPPCPFDGGKASLRDDPLDERYGYAHRYTISCATCPCTMTATDKSNPRGGYALSTGRGEVVRAWCKRL